jgi:hypothetical protein
MNMLPVLRQNRELTDEAGLPHRQPQDSTACQVGSFITCLMNTPSMLGENRELADKAGFLTANTNTLQHVK